MEALTATQLIDRSVELQQYFFMKILILAFDRLNTGTKAGAVLFGDRKVTAWLGWYCTSNSEASASHFTEVGHTLCLLKITLRQNIARTL